MAEILALIPARGGSKGLLRKNLRLLQGHPLIAYAIAAGLQAQHVRRVVCTTDDTEIAEIARRYGAEVPFIRPAELAQDLTPDLPVFQHALRWFAKHEGWQPEVVVHLRPTSPIRFAGQVDAAIEDLWACPDATAVRSVCIAPCNPYKMWRLPEDEDSPAPFMTQLLSVPGIPEPYNRPRQELPAVWWQTGTIDAVRSSVVHAGSMTGRHLLPLRTDSRYAVDIDGELGLRLAEVVMHGLHCIRPCPLLNWRQIRLLGLDVDGTLTPGTMYYSAAGEALKRFHTHDGHGLRMVREAGVQVALITAENTPIASARAHKLGITHVYTGVQDKVQVLEDLCTRLGIGLHEVAYIGDDLGDVPLMQALLAAGGMPCAVADARPEVKAVARYQCLCRGGDGAVRDVCDLIYAAKTTV
jgi:N-acylneuraminate cytidylyltransferase